MLRISNGAVMPAGTDRRPSLRSRRRERGCVRERFDSGLELDERAELRDARDAAGTHLADRVLVVGTVDHGSAVSCFNPSAIFCLSSSTRSTLTVISSPGLTTCDGVGHARPSHFGHVQQALHAAAEIHERAELAHRRDASGQHGARDDRLPDIGGARLLLLFEQRAARDDEVPAAFLVLDDPEEVDASVVRRRLRSDGCRFAKRDRRRAGARCGPRSRPSPRARPCPHRETRRGTRLRAGARSRRRRASLRESVSPPAVDTTIA